MAANGPSPTTTQQQKSVKVTLKSLLPVFKASRTTESIRLIFDDVRLRLVFVLLGRSEVRKTFKVPYEEGQVLHPVHNKNRCTGKIVTRPRFFIDSLANFHPKLEDISFSPRQAQLKMSSFVDDPASTKNLLLRTEMNLDLSEFETYTLTNNQDIVLTFSCKAFRAILEFCEQFDNSIDMYFKAHGDPLIFELNVGQSGTTADFHADFIFATRHYHAETTSNLTSTESEGSRLTPQAPAANPSPLLNHTPVSAGRRPIMKSPSTPASRKSPLVPISPVQPPAEPTRTPDLSRSSRDNPNSPEPTMLAQAVARNLNLTKEFQPTTKPTEDTDDEYVEGTPPPE